jgi:hypothetical protein
VENITSGGVLDVDLNIVEFEVIPGNTFYASISMQNISGRVLRPTIKVDLIHGIDTAPIGSYTIHDEPAPVPIIYDSHGTVNVTLPLSIQPVISYTSGGIVTEYNLPNGPMILDIGIYDSTANEQIGHLLMHIRNSHDVSNPELPIVPVPKVLLNSYLLTRVDNAGTEYAIDASYISSTDPMIGLSDIMLKNYSTTYLNNVFVEVFAVSNQKNTSGEYLPTDAVGLPVFTRDVNSPNSDFVLSDPAILSTGLNSACLENVDCQGTTIRSDFDLRVNISSFVSGMFIGDSSVPSPITLYVVTKYDAGNSPSPPEVLYNLCVTAIPLFIVKRADMLDNSECTCYVDSYTGPASSVVFSGCSPELASNACFSGLSYNQVYYYTLFTYNEAGHFSYADNCNRVVYGMFNSIPPGPICQFQMNPQYVTLTSPDCDPSFTKLNNIRLQWVNPSDPNLYGFRVYVSEYNHPGALCSARYAENFVEWNTVRAIDDVGSDTCQLSYTDPATACNMMLVYDTFLTPWITEGSPDLSRVAGETAYLTDGLDNADPTNGYRTLYELTEDGKSLVSNSGVRRDLKAGVTYFYTVFTYDVYGNYNAPSCIDRGAIATNPQP